MSSTVSPVSVRSAVTCQRASSVDQSAGTIRWLKRMCSSMPASAAVSLMYCRIDVAVGDRLLAVPRPERVAEGEHVGVGPDARVAEQVPRAADGVAGLEDGVGRPRALGLEVVAGADAGQAGADDEDVEVLHGRLRQAAAAGELVVQRAVRRRTARSATARPARWCRGRRGGSRAGCSRCSWSQSSRLHDRRACGTCASSGGGCRGR